MKERMTKKEKLKWTTIDLMLCSRKWKESVAELK